MRADLERDPFGFSLTAGGPFDRLVRFTGPIWWLPALAWLPLGVAAAAEAALGHGVSPIALDPSVHVRLLVALPLLFAGERVLGVTCRDAIAEIYRGGAVDRGALRDI